jgi:hypothetical protein
MVPLAALGVASPALASPKGPYAVFKECPLKTPGNELCLFGQTTSGEFTIGTTTVPINKTITLQGGATPTGGENEYFLLPAANGESLSKTELKVPGGLLDLVNCTEISNFFERIACEIVFENGTTGVTATTELVANRSNPAILNIGHLLSTEGTAFTLPVRVHLNNSLLGSACYIGSESNPVELHLITGTTAPPGPPAPNKPITGKVGKEETEEQVLVLRENSLVDNTFTAPGAEGCGGIFSFLIDPILDAKLKLPAKAGYNTAILNGTLKVTTEEDVLNSEK